MAKKLQILFLLALMALPLSGCYTAGYVSGSAVHAVTSVFTPSNNKN